MKYWQYFAVEKCCKGIEVCLQLLFQYNVICYAIICYLTYLFALFGNFIILMLLFSLFFILKLGLSVSNINFIMHYLWTCILFFIGIYPNFKLILFHASFSTVLLDVRKALSCHLGNLQAKYNQMDSYFEGSRCSSIIHSQRTQLIQIKFVEHFT